MAKNKVTPFLEGIPELEQKLTSLMDAQSIDNIQATLENWLRITEEHKVVQAFVRCATNDKNGRMATYRKLARAIPQLHKSGLVRSWIL